MSKVRVRFAPSPTGPLHIGGVRTALYNYLFAKQKGGEFILRIEDTDQTRFVEGAEDYILESLKWCGISPDEGQSIGGELGPYKQSERKELYKEHTEKLIENGFAYYAFDSAEQLDTLRKEAEANKQVFTYGIHTRENLENSLNLSKDEVSKRIENGEPFVVRFKIPKDENLVMNDLIRGEIKIDTNTLDDKILFKSDGMPTYHLANIVDDHLMQISHVIRGEEWLPSMALHILLYKAFGWDAPEFAHLPLLLKPTGKGKLSKRDGDKHGFPVFPLQWKAPDGNTSMGYREEGYLPEAFINMLSLLGWNPGTEQEIFSLEELVKEFSLEKVSKSGARFSPEKAHWFNGQYIQNKENSWIAEEFEKLLEKEGIQKTSEFNLKVVELLKERIVFTKDLLALSEFFYQTPNAYAEKAAKKAFKEGSDNILTELIQVIEASDFSSAETLQNTVKPWIGESGHGFGKVMQPLRVALVGDLQGPDVFEIMHLLSKEEVKLRLENAVEFITSQE